ncbi:uncharacterized protein LOC144005358 [Festucalex cinctus]
MTARFIKLRAEHDSLLTGAKFSASTAWRTILDKLGLQRKVTTLQAKKKWDNLKKKYKDCKYPGTGEAVAGESTAETWPWFDLMAGVLGQRPSITPPVIIASIHEDGAGPSQTMMKKMTMIFIGFMIEEEPSRAFEDTVCELVLGGHGL